MEIDTRSELMAVSDKDASVYVLEPEKGLALLYQAIEACITRNQGRPRSAALLAVSVENVQSIVDLFGSNVIEPVFMDLAARIRECLRCSDVTARLSESQLGIILPYFRFNGATVAVKRILALRARPILASHFGAIDLKLSVGSVFFPRPDLGPSEIITRAQAAVAYQQTKSQETLELTRSLRERVNILRPTTNMSLQGD